MDIIDDFLEKHEEIRRLMDAVAGCFPHEPASLDEFRPEMLKRLKETADSLIAKLEEHEALEQRFLSEIARDVGPEGADCIAAVSADHEAINDISNIFESISRLTEEKNSYSFRFAVSSLAYRLNRHLSYEENKVFPCLRRTVSPARLAAVTARLSCPRAATP
ncbi:MAG TPA: hemerythrin domain-containing protein [Elusimicrobiota bacterium]|nr:hemerythrin domain-containing protein [Elusimicrobiota bacterium]